MVLEVTREIELDFMTDLIISTKNVMSCKIRKLLDLHKGLMKVYSTTNEISRMQAQVDFDLKNEQHRANKTIVLLETWSQQQREALFRLGAYCVCGGIANFNSSHKKYTNAWANRTNQQKVILNMVDQVEYFYILTEQETRNAMEIADFQQQVAIQNEKRIEKKNTTKFNPVF